MNVAASVEKESTVSGVKRWLLVTFPTLLLLVFLLLPWPLMEKLRAIGRTVCMLRPEHSYFLAGEQLPLEARTMGIHAGFLIALVYLLLSRRRRAIRMPHWTLIAILVGFVAVMGFDGLNATAYDNGLPHLYAPSNPLRLITGLLTGVATASFLLPAANVAVWKKSKPQAAMGSSSVGFKELLGLLAVEALFFLGVASGAPWLLYPVSFITAGGVVVLFFVATLVIVAQTIERSRRKIAGKWGVLYLVNITLLWTVVELGGLLAYKLWIHQCPLQG